MKIFFCALLSIVYICIAYPQNAIESVKADLDKEEIKSHIGYIASDELQGRDTPSEGLEKAADYIAKNLRDYGVKAFSLHKNYYQPVKFQITTAPEKIEIKLGENVIAKKSNAYLFSGSKNFSFKGDVVYVDYGLESDFEKNDVAGKIVIANIGDGKSQNPRDYYYLSFEKGRLAKEAGAKAFIEVFPNIPFQLVNYLMREGLGLDKEGESNGEFVQFYLDGKMENIISQQGSGTKAEIIVKGKENQRFVTNNVLGYVEGTDKNLKNEYIVCSAHYDHVGIGRPDATGDSIYNGARDNAVGVTSLLISAKNVAKNPLKRSVIFVFFTAEEKGLMGSEWFVENLPVETEKVVYCLNNDNGSYTDTTIVSIPGLSKNNTETLIKDACNTFGLTATDDFAEANMLFSASDNIHFSQIGIPSVTYSLGFRAFDSEVRKYYHQPRDEPETLNYNYLYKFCGGYNLSLRLIGNKENQPFWNEGDSYYELGKKLYER